MTVTELGGYVIVPQNFFQFFKIVNRMEATNNCRICLAETGDLQTIFTSVELEESRPSMHLSEMICSFAQVQITFGDGLPEQICGSCVEKTVQMYIFKLRIEESDRFLKSKLFDMQISSDSSERNTDVKVPCYVQNSEVVDQFADCDLQHFVSEGNKEMYDEQRVTKSQKVKKFGCSICNKKFTREDLLLKHKIAHVVKMHEFQDSKMNGDSEGSRSKELSKPVVFFRGVALEPNNLKSEGNLQCFTCALCNCVFTNEELFQKHFNEHLIQGKSDTIDGDILCKICKHEIKDIHELKEHIRKRHNEKESDGKYPCPHCLMDYSKEDDLQHHLKYHEINDNDVKPPKKTETKGEYYCNHCDKSFEAKVQLRRHLRRVRRDSTIAPEKKTHVCQICLKEFNQLSNLKDHMRTHNGEKPFLCPTCGKGFNQQGNLKQHQVRHSGVKSHKCSICEYGFASRGELKAHVRKHTGARPFVCNSCGNGFTTSSSLTKHKRIHSGEKPYECEFCKMKFSRSGILTRHRRIHTGEKPYICNICQKAFTQSNDLTSHQRIHTGEKPYKCDECGQPFRQSSALKTHKKVHLVPKPKQIKQNTMKEKSRVFVEDGENLLIVKFEDIADIS